jgi:hypothetical protein
VKARIRVFIKTIIEPRTGKRKCGWAGPRHREVRSAVPEEWMPSPTVRNARRNVTT